MVYTDPLSYTDFTIAYSRPTVEESLIDWMINETNEDKAIRILKVLRKMNKKYI
jgi:hypothetical protein